MIAVHVIAIVLVALAAALSVAHALELPGKMRLDRDTYLKVQHIYYPGFTFGGISEPLGAIVTAILLYFVPAGTEFWLVLTALTAMLVMMAVFWAVTQPVNKAWTKGLRMSAAGTGFFGTGGKEVAGDWTELRDRWERSHVARAVLATSGFLCLLVALALRT